MYTLYYLNKNLQIETMKVDSLDVPILVPEDLIFCDLRKGINFIKEPHACIAFTDIERLIIQSEFNDVSLIKEGDYRKQNSYLTPLCPIDGVPLVLDDVDFKKIYWNYPTQVNVEISNNKIYWGIYAYDQKDGSVNNVNVGMVYFRLHDEDKNIYSNVIQYYSAT